MGTIRTSPTALWDGILRLSSPSAIIGVAVEVLAMSLIGEFRQALGAEIEEQKRRVQPVGTLGLEDLSLLEGPPICLLLHLR